MFSITELPRKDGSPVGEFFVRHRSDSFTTEGFGFRFVNGVTVDPVRGRVADRLHSAYGPDVSFEARARADGELALAWMTDHGAHPERVAEASVALDARFPSAPVEEPAMSADAEPDAKPSKSELAPKGKHK